MLDMLVLVYNYIFTVLQMEELHRDGGLLF